jgi:hypothetical protein
MTQEQKLERWAEHALRRNIEKIIVPDDNNGYIVFGRYHIRPENSGFTVSNWDRDIHTFGSKRAAMSWCVAEKRNQFKLANEIITLDRKDQQLSADIHCRRGVASRGRHESFYEIVNMKIQPKIDVYNQVHSELEKCINQAKYLQIRGFSNETE